MTHVAVVAKARHVHLGGNGLPGRWAGRRDFTVADIGFGLGHSFLATWAAWQGDPQRPARLHYVAVFDKPPSRADLQQAHGQASASALARQLVAAWPLQVSGLHRLDLAQGAVQLLLAFGEVRRLLPAMDFQADAFYLDGSAHAGPWERRVIQALSRRARPGATLVSCAVADQLPDELRAAGFELTPLPGIAGPGDTLLASFAPRPGVRRVRRAESPVERRAIVVGAGLAGACTASALAAQGFQVEVLDRQAEPAGGSSGNPAGLFHATVHADDNPYARLFRAAALHTARLLGSLSAHEVAHQVGGLLRLELERSQDAMQTVIDRLQLPPELVQALDAAAASQRAGLPVDRPAWFYPQGGWVAPAALVRERLGKAGVRFRGMQDVKAVRRDGDTWTCLDAQGRSIASAPHLVLANAEQANSLLGALGAPVYPWDRTRGQVSLLRPPEHLPPLRVPVAGAGYALPLPDGRMLCGATTRDDGDDTTVLATDHRSNRHRLQALFGWRLPDEVDDWQGRVGWRVQPADRLPVAGPVADWSPEAIAVPADQCRRVPRRPGLHVACAFGARGITLAPLLADVVAARLAGSPVPLPQDLVDLVDPARWRVRQARSGA